MTSVYVYASPDRFFTEKLPLQERVVRKLRDVIKAALSVPTPL